MQKAEHDCDRRSLTSFQQIINVGPSLEATFQRIGMKSPVELIGADPFQLYQQLCATEQQFYDPCVLDCFLAAVDFMNGNPPRVWWDFTSQRKAQFTNQVDQFRAKWPRET